MADFSAAALESVAQTDSEIAQLIDAEQRRQSETITLIPSENHVSAAVAAATGSVLTNKYSEGYPGKRYYEGQQIIDQFERLAQVRAESLFGVDHANVQPYSGSPANFAVYFALLEPGDTFLAMDLAAGGHLTHGSPVSITGKWFRPVSYGVRRETGRIDMDEVREVALRERPKMILCGGTAIPRIIDFEGFAQVAREVDAVLVADVAHIAGLIVGGAHPSPVGHADIISTTTHKTLRGPRGAMLMTTEEHALKIDKAIFPGLQGGPHENAIAGIAIALHEAAGPEFRDYANAIVENANALAGALDERGFDLVSGGTDNHLILIDLSNKGITGRPAAEGLDRAGISTNRNAVPFDERKPLDPSGLRIGTPAITTRGFDVGEMETVARWIDDGIEAVKRGDEGALEAIRAEVRELAAGKPVPGIPAGAVAA
jgi:glycine hydroxymethyltransferase